MTMEESVVRKEMMRLWKENFHDSDEYIRLIFDSYFTLDMVEYEVRDDKIVAAILAIPYRFGNSHHQLRGLYLCGLSTDVKYRRKGIMNILIERFRAKTDTAEYAFLFLIPAGTGLQKYYHDRGFVNAFYKIPLRYVSSHNFRRDFENSIQGDHRELEAIKRKYYDSLTLHKITVRSDGKVNENEDEQGKELRNKICIFIKYREGLGKDMQLLHTSDDIQNAIDECVISGGEVYALMDRNKDVTAVTFFHVDKDDKNISVYYLTHSDAESKYRIMEEISHNYDGYSITQWHYPVKSEAGGLWQPFYSASLPEAPGVGAVGEAERVYYRSNHSEVYGMARILNIYEILKFQAEERSDLKYSILVKEGFPLRYIRYEAKDGQMRRSDVTEALSDSEKQQVLMTERDVAEILFRRPDSDPIVEEVMELPPLSGSISLMLD